MSLESKLEPKWGSSDRDFYGNAENVAYVKFKGDANSGVFGDRKVYNEAIKAIKAEFKLDLEVHHGIRDKDGRSGNISLGKAGALFDIAWDRGHSNGYPEVANEYDTMVCLIL